MNERHTPHPSAAMPKWLVRAIGAKLVAIALIVVAVLWYAGMFG